MVERGVETESATIWSIISTLLTGTAGFTRATASTNCRLTACRSAPLSSRSDRVISTGGATIPCAAGTYMSPLMLVAQSVYDFPDSALYFATSSTTVRQSGCHDGFTCFPRGSSPGQNTCASALLTRTTRGPF